MMRKLLIIGLLVLAAVLVVSCAPKDNSAVPTEDELFKSGAIAGQAIAVGCSVTNVVSCNLTNTGVRVNLSAGAGRTITYTNRCGAAPDVNAVAFSCLTPQRFQRCITRCVAGERCQRGQCVLVSCGNRQVNAGETCSTCPVDVVCCWYDVYVWI